MISRSVLTNRKSRVFLLENGLAVRFPENGKMREHFSRVKDGVLVAVQRRDAGRAQHEKEKRGKIFRPLGAQLVQLDFKGIDRTGRQHTDRGLIYFRRTGDVAQKTEGFPVNAEESGDGLSRSCPVTGEGIGKTIGSRPDRKIRIVHYKRIRRITNRFTCHGKKLLLLVE